MSTSEILMKSIMRHRKLKGGQPKKLALTEAQYLDLIIESQQSMSMYSVSPPDLRSRNGETFMGIPLEIVEVIA